MSGPNPLKRYFRRVRDIKLQYKLMLSYLLLILFLLGTVSLAIFQVSSGTLLRYVSNSTVQNFQQTNSFLEFKLYKVTAVSDVIVTDSRISALLSKDPAKTSQVDQVGDLFTLKEYVCSFQDERDIHRVRLYVHDGQMYSYDQVNLFGLRDAVNTQWYARLQESGDKVFFSPYSYIQGGEQGGAEVVSLVRDLANPNNYRDTIGVLRIDVELDNITSVLEKADLIPDSVTFLINGAGDLVASSNPAMLETLRINNEAALPQGVLAVGTGEQLREIRLGKNKVLAMSSPVDGTDWTIATIVPYSSFTKDIDGLRGLMLAVAAITAVIAYAMAFLVTRSITGRVSKLIRRMGEVRNGHTNLEIENDRHDEIGVLYENYNSLIQRQSQLMDEKYQMGRELNAAELNALQSQINPHFLYNTLDMIGWMGYSGNAGQIQSVVTALAKFYRQTLSKGKSVVTVADELCHGAYYMEIQNMRFSGRVTYEAHVEDALLGCPIPKITLQPLLENAILHGILETPEKAGSIVVTGWMEGQTAVLCVEDDGAGISEENLQPMPGGDEPSGESLPAGDPAASGSSCGVRNIDKRIKLLFGPEYGLRFERRSPRGTRVLLRLRAPGEEPRSGE